MTEAEPSPSSSKNPSHEPAAVVVAAVGMWATRQRCPSEASCPQLGRSGTSCRKRLKRGGEGERFRASWPPLRQVARISPACITLMCSGSRTRQRCSRILIWLHRGCARCSAHTGSPGDARLREYGLGRGTRVGLVPIRPRAFLSTVAGQAVTLSLQGTACRPRAGNGRLERLRPASL